MYLLVCTRHDAATETTYRWGEEVREILKAMGKKYLVCFENKAVSEEVCTALRENRISKIIFYGHGTEESLVGNDDKPVFDRETLEKNGITVEYFHTLACLSGKKLGPDLCERGATKKYLGYIRAIGWHKDHTDDFKACYNNPLIRLLEGDIKTEEEVYKQIKESLRQLTYKLIDLSIQEERVSQEKAEELQIAAAVVNIAYKSLVYQTPITL